MATVNMHKKCHEAGRAVFVICEQTDRQTDMLIAILCIPTWDKVTITVMKDLYSSYTDARWPAINDTCQYDYSNKCERLMQCRHHYHQDWPAYT